MKTQKSATCKECGAELEPGEAHPIHSCIAHLRSRIEALSLQMEKRAANLDRARTELGECRERLESLLARKKTKKD